MTNELKTLNKTKIKNMIRQNYMTLPSNFQSKH